MSFALLRKRTKRENSRPPGSVRCTGSYIWIPYKAWEKGIRLRGIAQLQSSWFVNRGHQGSIPGIPRQSSVDQYPDLTGGFLSCTHEHFEPLQSLQVRASLWSECIKLTLRIKIKLLNVALGEPGLDARGRKHLKVTKSIANCLEKYHYTSSLPQPLLPCRFFPPAPCWIGP